MQVSIAMRPFLAVSSLSWPVQGLLVCAVFLVMGVAVVGDYAVGNDTPGQRLLAERNLAFITGDADRLGAFAVDHDRYYGAAFELPLLLIERGVEWKDSRSIYLMRHLVTHGFFLIGGFCCSLLMYRLSNRRGLALVVLLLFVMQPRLYAHSFFNSKDLPFLSMFMVTLCLTHRAFRKETVGAFLLCGVSVGILTNLRIMGVMLYPAVLALRGLDLVQERRRRGRGRKHVLTTGAVFALAGLGMLYALSPVLWANPFEFITALQTLAHHPTTPLKIFQGEVVNPNNLPWHYIPTWMGVSTPPGTLLCGVLGVIGVGVRSIREPQSALGNTDLRFKLLLIACLILPIVAIVVYGSTLYNNWRQVYFLHAPLCCLASLGLQWAEGMRRPAAVAYAMVGLGVLVTGWEMVRLHPHQHVYFNVLVDRTTPEGLRLSYMLDPWMTSCREGLDFLRRRYPDTTVFVRYSWPVDLGWRILPLTDRARLMLARDDEAADFQILCGSELQKRKKLSLKNALYVRKVYNNTLLTVLGLVTVPNEERSMAHRTESYRGVTSGRLVQQGVFDLYRYGDSRWLGYARDGCTASNREEMFFLHVEPEERADLPAGRRRYGFDNRDFVFIERGRWSGDKCWTTVVLPDYPIARIRTGQYIKAGQIWESNLLWPEGESEPASRRSN